MKHFGKIKLIHFKVLLVFICMLCFIISCILLIPENSSLEKKIKVLEEYILTLKEMKKNKFHQLQYNYTKLHNEYELIPYVRFTLARLYVLDPGMGKRVVEKPIGVKKKEILNIVGAACNHLNKQGKYVYSFANFSEGIYRTVPGVGTQYEILMKDSGKRIRKISLFRPFKASYVVSDVKIDKASEKVHLVLPLKGRVNSFKVFMDRFQTVCLRFGLNTRLIVVNFGKDDLFEVKNILNLVKLSFPYLEYKLISLNQNFSRGVGLQKGCQSVPDDGLIFFCDVDIAFNSEFIDRCKLHTKKAYSVYSPIVFSLYNPFISYPGHQLVNKHEQLVISKETGFWRDFGFGMMCLFKSDLMAVNPFEDIISGWGMEDVLLFRRILQSPLHVIRATDPGIMHLWHPKHCDKTLSLKQYLGCMRSRALNEASHSQLGLLAFKNEIMDHQRQTDA